jgi:N6-adenosine-specific RNA methylase IME4
MTRYAVILADPPWQYRAWKGDRGMRTAESFYPTMPAADLHALRPRIDEWAARDCALFLWATPPALPEAMELLYRCWQDRTPYDESTYLNALKRRGSPLLNSIVASP